MEVIYNTSLMCNLRVYLKSAVTYCNFYNRQIINERIPDNKHSCLIVNFTTFIELFG